MRYLLIVLLCFLPLNVWAGSSKTADFSKPNVRVIEIRREAKKYDGGSKHVKVFMDRRSDL